MANKPAAIFTPVLDWLRAGYPEGVPPKDYFPLLALLKKQLTDAEASQVIDSLLKTNPDEVSRQEIEAAIIKLTESEPTEDETRLVAGRLAAGGWPLTGFKDAL